ncbi:MAG: hypothetical protein HXY53_08050 [Nitrospirae bacterium]|nr:hypothetical protein [Nitrospirota bacterium]
MLIHNKNAIKRDIKFTEKINVQMDVKASDICCWNCFWSVMTYEGLWCQKDMEEVNLKDLCNSWEGDFPRSNI